jgi:C4-dicarboxylate-specific signal transduction histidine kinase
MANSGNRFAGRLGIKGKEVLLIGILCLAGITVGIGLGYFWGYDLIRNYVAQGAIVTGILLLLLMACTFWMARIYMTPIIKPKKTTDEISREDPDYKMEARRPDKIEDLQRANEKIRETQSQLMQAEKMGAIGKIASGIAHEVKTPWG